MPADTETPPTTPEVKPFKDFVPAEYHDRGYLKDLLDKPQGAETTADFFKRFDGAQKLLGQRPAGIPAADAKPEEVEAFLSKLRPEKPESYDLKAILGEGEAKDPELVKAMRDAFHYAGNDQRQAMRFLEKFVPVLAAREKAVADKKKAEDTAFNEIVQKAFGAEQTKVLERAKAMIGEFTPAELAPYKDKISNENLAILAGILNAVHLKYGLEDKIKGPNEGGGTGGDVEALRAEMAALIAKPEYRDEFKPEHGATRAKVEELAKKIAALQAK